MPLVNKKPRNKQSQIASPPPFPDILYIMGTGRSGTTILEILLSNNAGIFGVGEITHLFQDGFTDNETCSCGKPATVCEHWSTVRQQCGWKETDILELNQLFVDIAWHTQFPKVAAGRVPTNQRVLFNKTNKCLFQTSADISGASIIIDSSKYAGRALELARAFPKKVKIICLTRSPAGLVKAFKKTDAAEQKPKSLSGTLFYYLYTIACFRVVTWILKSSVLRIRYEDMISKPEDTLAKIESWAGLDLSQTKNILKEKQWLETGHMVTGNRLRRQGRVKFRPSEQHVKAEGFLTRSVVSLMNFYRSILGF